MMTELALETFPHLWETCMAYLHKTEENTRSALSSANGENFSRVLERNATPDTLRRWESGEIPNERARHLTDRRVKSIYRKTVDDFEAKLSRIALTPPPDMIEIQVEYKRNRTWGWNPTATVWGRKSCTGSVSSSGYASGCGYDKTSAAVTYAMNANASCLRVLYDAFENSLAAGVPLPVETWYTRFYTVENDPATTFWGKPFSPLPKFTTDGAGMSSIREVYEKALGYDFTDIGSGDAFNFYQLRRRDPASIPAD